MLTGRRRRHWYGQRAFAIGLCMMMISLAGCARASPGSFCQIYLPVYTVAQDTPDTQRQVSANNAVWWDICAVSADSAPDGS